MNKCLNFKDEFLKSSYAEYTINSKFPVLKAKNLIILLVNFFILISIIIETIKIKDSKNIIYLNFAIFFQILLLLYNYVFLKKLKIKFSNNEFSKMLLFIAIRIFYSEILQILLFKELTLILELLFMIDFMFFFSFNTYKFKIFPFFFGKLYCYIRNFYTCNMNVRAIIIIVSILAFYVFFIYHLEKSLKESFIIYNKNEEEIDHWNKFINILPEGIAVLRKDKSDIFVNKAMKNIFNDENHKNIKNKIFDLKEIKNNLQNSEVIESDNGGFVFFLIK